LRRRWKGIYAACDVLFAHTEPTIRGLRDLGVPDARIVKVPLGEVASLFRPGMEADPTGLGLTSGGIPIVLMLGDVRRNKGVDLLLEAAALLKARNVSFRLLIAGRHPAGRPVEFEALAERLGIADLVEFRHLFIPEADMPAYMRAAAVVAFPYRAMDSQSAGAVWALSLGRPVVASRVGGLAELLEGCGCGRLIAEGSVEQLADALEALLRDPAEAERIGAAGARYARSALAWDRIATTTLTAYRGVPENSR
jgi:glycosyltransferase involved in cell wall biosynthesis